MKKKVRVADKTVDLRRGVDHIGVCVPFVIHDGKGKIMLHKRSQKCRDEQGRWDVGGGAIEFGESIEDAVKREIKEEFCVEPLDIQFLTVYDAHRDNNGTLTHWIAIVNAIKVDPKKIKIGEPDKIDEIGWFASKNLPSPLHSQFQKSFAAAKAAGIIS